MGKRILLVLLLHSNAWSADFASTLKDSANLSDTEKRKLIREFVAKPEASDYEQQRKISELLLAPDSKISGAASEALIEIGLAGKMDAATWVEFPLLLRGGTDHPPFNYKPVVMRTMARIPAPPSERQLLLGLVLREVTPQPDANLLRYYWEFLATNNVLRDENVEKSIQDMNTHLSQGGPQSEQAKRLVLALENTKAPYRDTLFEDFRRRLHSRNAATIRDAAQFFSHLQNLAPEDIKALEGALEIVRQELQPNESNIRYWEPSLRALTDALGKHGEKVDQIAPVAETLRKLELATTAVPELSSTMGETKKTMLGFMVDTSWYADKSVPLATRQGQLANQVKTLPLGNLEKTLISIIRDENIEPDMRIKAINLLHDFVARKQEGDPTWKASEMIEALQSVLRGPASANRVKPWAVTALKRFGVTTDTLQGLFETGGIKPTSDMKESLKKPCDIFAMFKGASQ